MIGGSSIGGAGASPPFALRARVWNAAGIFDKSAAAEGIFDKTAEIAVQTEPGE